MSRTPLSRQADSLLAARPDPSRVLRPLAPAWRVDAPASSAPDGNDATGAPPPWSQGLLGFAKPADLPSDVTPDPRRDSARAAAFRWLRDDDPAADPPILVHRLDAPTSGVLLLARDAAIAALAQAAFAARAVDKRYLCRVSAPPPHEVWEVRDYLRIPRRVGPGDPVVSVRAGGQPAHTSFRALGADDAGHWVEARPHTGRTHQIRVHLAGCGLPLVGDPIYGGPPASRLALHAWRLALRVEGGTLVWEAPWRPEEGGPRLALLAGAAA